MRGWLGVGCALWMLWGGAPVEAQIAQPVRVEEPVSVDLIGDPIELDPFDDTTGWTQLNNDAGNIALETFSVTDTDALEFDKLDGAANTVYAIIQKTITSVDICSTSRVQSWIVAGLNIPTLTDVVNGVVYLGTNSSNYNSWTFPVESFTAGRYEEMRISTANASGFAGDGWDCSAVTWIAVGLEFAAQDDTLTDILWDRLAIVRGFIDPPTLVTYDHDLLDSIISNLDTLTVTGYTIAGATPYRNPDVDETEDNVKTSETELYWCHVVNLTASTLYLQMYNDTAANVTVGTTPPTFTFPIPTLGDTNGAGWALGFPGGTNFSAALSVAATTTFDGSSGPGANTVFLNCGYK